MQKNLKKYGWLFLLPTAVAFLFAFAAPFVLGVGLSFTRFRTVTDAAWVGLQNYVQAFTADSGFLHALWFTALFSGVSIITVNVLAFALALLLTRGLRGTNFFRGVFFMPNLIGGIVLGYIWNLLINGVLAWAGVDITYQPAYGFWWLVALTNWQLIGYMMVIYIAALQKCAGRSFGGGGHRRRIPDADTVSHQAAAGDARGDHLHFSDPYKHL